jgi:haloacetate dehalogenase
LSVLALRSAAGPIDSWYAQHGGPLALWRDLASNVTGQRVHGGHFFPEAHPDDTANALARHFAGTACSSRT